MLIHRSLNEISRAHVAGGALTIGNFDGVHRGHQRIIATAARLAHPVVAMTFDPSAMAVLNPRQAPQVITPMDLRLVLLESAGVDVAVVAATDAELLDIEPERFVSEIIAGRFAPRVVVEGPTFGFGRGRRGDVDLLARLGPQHGFEVRVVEQFLCRLPSHETPTPVSSTLVRRLVVGGSMDAAAECLGRPFRLVGEPVPGLGLGRQIGVPTVNLDCGRQLLPAEGIYAAKAFWSGGESPAAVSVGPALTFGRDATVVEAHLVDWNGRFGAARMELDMLARLRGIVKFESADELVEQINRDIEDVRRLTAGGADARR